MPLVVEEPPAVEEQSLGDPPPSKPLPKIMPYLAACFCVTFMGGGLIMGVAPFIAQLEKERYIKDAKQIYDVSFQILVWGTVLASHLLGRLGPKITAFIGICISLPGIFVLAFLDGAEEYGADPLVVTLAFGAIGAGGNYIYLSSFQFAALFPENIGRADGVIAGLWSAAGLMLMIMNFDFITIHIFFRVWLVVAAIVTVCIVMFYPNKPYSPGEQASLHGLSCQHMSNPLNIMEYKNSIGALKSTRYWFFALSFSWAAVYSVWVNGIVVDGLYTAVPEEYTTWAQPILTNATVFFTWIVGSLIDKFNFLVVPFVQAILCTALVLLALFRDSAGAAWLNLLVLNWAVAVSYTMEFVFLHKMLKESDFTTGLLVLLVCQAICQLVVAPGLAPDPWEINNIPNYGPPCYMLLGLSAMLYAWPLAEMLVFRHQDEKAVVLLDSDNTAVSSDA